MDTLTWIVSHEDRIDHAKAINRIGGKALGLHELTDIGVIVPDWLTITTEMLAYVFQSDAQLSALFKKEDISILEKGTLIRERLKNISLDEACMRELTAAWKKISNDSKSPVAVRSSAADEDGQNLSFAGQMESFLNIRDHQSFVKALCGCWASLFCERALFYRLAHGIDPLRVHMGVVVQKMIDSEVSGVIFTSNPLTGNNNEMLVSSTWGLGEGLVSGALDADTFTIDAGGSVIKRDIVEKKQRVAYNDEGGTGVTHVEEKKQFISSLEDTQLNELYLAAIKIKTRKAMAMDIEFAIAEKRLYVVQARPITNLKKPQKKDTINVWDNSNIVESYSGVTTPMTFSFIRRAYYAVYCQFCETIGVDKKIIIKNRHVFENMLGLIRGRVYYNLRNWYKLVSLMPGFKYNKRFMEQMMGLQVVRDVDLRDKPMKQSAKYFVELPRLIKVAGKMIFAHMQLDSKVREFQDNFKQVYSKYACLDFDRLTPVEIRSVYQALEDEILWKWKAPITNDFEAMIFYGLLKQLTVKWGVDPKATLQNDLLCGQGGIKSTQVTLELFSLAQMIEKDADLKSAFLQATPEAALQRVRTDASFLAVKEKFECYLSEFGVRCIEEMKLESVPIKDDPVFCIAMIQNYLRNRLPDPAKQKERETLIYTNAHVVMKDKLKHKRICLCIPKLRVYLWILRNTKKAVKNRENQRFCRTQAYSLIRTLFLAIGRNWHDKGILESTRDIFYLEMDEVWSFIEGTATCTDLKGLVILRKKEFDEYRKMDVDDHIETYGEVYFDNQFTRQSNSDSSASVLRGLGCCAGVVENSARVVLKPDKDLKLNGEIMVARQTDPGWVVLFPSISGLIVEKGSMLSHSAIVAREMGIPAVVGVKDATKILASGDRVRLNGEEGVVTILQKVKPCV